MGAEVTFQGHAASLCVVKLDVVEIALSCVMGSDFQYSVAPETFKDHSKEDSVE